MSSRSLRAAAAVALAVLIPVGCSSGDSDSATAPSVPMAPSTTAGTTAPSTAAPSTTSTTEAPDAPPEAAVLAAVDDFWRMYLEVGANTGPFDPDGTRTRLAARSTGESIQVLFNLFQSHSLAGYLVRGEVETAPEVLSIQDRRAQVADCVDDRTGLYRVETGERVDTDDPLRRQLTYELVSEDGVWKVSAIQDGGTGCVVSS